MLTGISGISGICEIAGDWGLGMGMGKIQIRGAMTAMTAMSAAERVLFPSVFYEG